MKSAALGALSAKNSKLLCWIGGVLLVLSTLLQLVLLYSLIWQQGSDLGIPVWLGLHLVATLLATIGTVIVAKHIVKGPVLGIGALSLLIGLTIPVVGALGLALSFPISVMLKKFTGKPLTTSICRLQHLLVERSPNTIAVVL